MEYINIILIKLKKKIKKNNFLINLFIYNKFIYNQAQFDTLLKVFNFESKTKYTPPSKPTLYNPQQEIKVKLEDERKPIIEDQKRELIVPSNQGKENDFFSIYDED